MVAMPADTLSQELVLKKLDTEAKFNSQEFASAGSYDHQKVVGIVRGLAGLEIVAIDGKSIEKYALSDEAKQYVSAGSPEVQVFKYAFNKCAIVGIFFNLTILFFRSHPNCVHLFLYLFRKRLFIFDF